MYRLRTHHTSKTQQQQQQQPEHQGTPDQADSTLHEIDIRFIASADLGAIRNLAGLDHRHAQSNTQRTSTACQNDTDTTTQLVIRPFVGLISPTVNCIFKIADNGKPGGSNPQGQPVYNSKGLL